MCSNSFEYPNELNKVFDKLNSYNLRAIIVGGYLRDYFFHIASKDIDVEVYGLDHVEQLVPILQEFGKVYTAGKSFGVCKLRLKSLDLDLSLPRIEKKISAGHRGFKIATKKNLDYKTAASRRDFTINAIGYNREKNKILDPFFGCKDIEERILRVVNEKSFIEDPLRVFRAMGMIARFELNCEEETLNLCKKIVEENMLYELSKERIYEEFKKLFTKAKKPSLGLIFLKQTGVIDFLIQGKIDATNWSNILKAIDVLHNDKRFQKLTNQKTNIELSLAVICYNLTEDAIGYFLSKLTHETKLQQKIFLLIKYTKLLQTEIEDYKLKKMATQVSLVEIFLLGDAYGLKTQYLKKKAMQYNIMQNPIPNLLQGRDIISLGMQPSKQFGEILQRVYELQLQGVLNTKKEALNYVASEYCQSQ